MDDYLRFLATKRVKVEPSGFDVSPSSINPKLFRFQNAVTRWQLRQGRGALFAGMGMGKTAMQLEWARHVADHTGKTVLIGAPLSVAPQTVKEGVKFGIEVRQVEEPDQIGDAAIVVTNYANLHKFDARRFGGFVPDESSILKHYSKTFFALTEQFGATVPFLLPCSATPAPNDYVELGNHSTFLQIMHFKDVLARWFVGEGDVARHARLKRHAEADFWRWVTSWAVCISHPRDLGPEYDMPGYDLPELRLHEHHLKASNAMIERAWREGRLLPDGKPSATGHMRLKRETLAERVALTHELVANYPADKPIIVWCDTDFEADALRAVLPEAGEVRGSYTRKRKEAALDAFSDGNLRILITKPEIAGHGLNWQHCRKVIFAGLSFSFERWYQAIGRVHRFGQTEDVDVDVIVPQVEETVAAILNNKRREFQRMQARMNAAMHEHGLFRETSSETTYLSALGNQPVVLPEWVKSRVS